MNGRFHLTLLATAAALPFLVLSVVLIALFAAQKREAMEIDLWQAAHSSRQAVERYLATTITTLETLATSSHLNDQDLPEFYDQAQRVLARQPDWLSLTLNDPHEFWQLVDLRRPLESERRKAVLPDDIERVVRTRRPLIGSVRYDRPATEHIFSLHVPVIQSDAVLYVLSVEVRTSALTAILRDQEIPEDWIGALLDQTATILARTRAATEFIGTPASASLAAAIARNANADELFFRDTKEGLRVYTALSRVPLSGWIVAIGAPAAAVEDPLNRAVLAVVLETAIAVGLALVLASVLIRSLLDRQRAERQLIALQAQQAAEQRIAEIATHFPGVIFRGVWERDGRIHFPYLSEGGESLIALAQQACTAPLSLQDLAACFVSPEDQEELCTQIRAAAQRLAPLSLEFRLQTPRGVVWVRSSVRPHRGADGATLWDGVLLDITDRKDAEVALQAAKTQAKQASAAKTRFLAAVSHDLRQPIQAIALFLAVLAGRPLDHGARELVERIGTALSSLQGMLGALLDMARLEAGMVQPRVQPFALDDLLQRLAGEFAAQAAAAGLSFESASPGLTVSSDPVLLEQILRNLLSNALKYTAAGGIALACTVVDGAVEIAVSDTGCGIPPDKLEAIFEDFVQLDNPARDRTRGLGLGLATVARTAKLLGYPLAVRSSPGQGSTFLLRVPLAAARPERSAASPHGDEGSAAHDPAVSTLTGRRVLLVEDDATVLSALEMMLRCWGLEVVTATSLHEAAAVLARLDRAPDGLLVDYRLPEGATGADVIALARAERWVPAIVLTGDTAPERLREARQTACALLHKPIDPATLRQTLVAVLSSPAADPCPWAEAFPAS